MVFKSVCREWLEAQMDVETDECIIWPFHVNTSGYSSLSINGVSELGHIIVCKKKKGPKPSKDAIVLHNVCFNKLCVNHRHLNWGTLATRYTSYRKAG